MASESRATTVWRGDLESGQGTLSTASSVIPDVEVSWSRRVERTGDATSPEELLAGAHAACYCMGLSAELGKAGTAAERLETTCTVSFVPGEGVKSSRLEVRASIPDIDEAAFQEAAQAAGEGCPISGALRGNVEISVDATLES